MPFVVFVGNSLEFFLQQLHTPVEYQGMEVVPPPPSAETTPQVFLPAGMFSFFFNKN